MLACQMCNYCTEVHCPLRNKLIPHYLPAQANDKTRSSIRMLKISSTTLCRVTPVQWAYSRVTPHSLALEVYQQLCCHRQHNDVTAAWQTVAATRIGNKSTLLNVRSTANTNNLKLYLRQQHKKLLQVNQAQWLLNTHWDFEGDFPIRTYLSHLPPIIPCSVTIESQS